MSYLSDLAYMPIYERTEFLETLSAEEIHLLNTEFIFTAHPHQIPPKQDYLYWVLMGGRGAGKTMAGANAVIDAVGKGCRHIALIAQNIHEAADIMVTGISGIMACSPDDDMPIFRRSERCLVWKNGAKATLFSAAEPDGLRGFQFDFAWCDEFAKWTHAQDTWDNLQFCMRLGECPKIMITTTPRTIPILDKLIKDKNSVVTHATTYDNAIHLASGFLDTILGYYKDSRLGRQEIFGELLPAREGAFWTRDLLDKQRIPPERTPEHYERIIVSVDPPITTGENADECGIIVSGLNMEYVDGVLTKRAYILADYSIKGLTPNGWAKQVIKAYQDYSASLIVAEVNQGGEMVKTILNHIDSNIPYKAVRAMRGKIGRAEPVASLYEQGQIFHTQSFNILEDQMCCFALDNIARSGFRSPDRVDALVWGITELMLNRPESYPTIRGV